MKPLRTYMPEDSARERVARALGNALDAAGYANRAFADDIGKDEKTVRKMRGGELDLKVTALIQVQSDRAFEEIVDALRAQRAQVYTGKLAVPPEAAAAGVGGACTSVVQCVLEALRDGRITVDEVEQIERGLVEVKRHARNLRASCPGGAA